MPTVTVADPTPNLVASSRMRLQEALETASRAVSGRALSFDPGLCCGRYVLPALAAVPTLVGFGGGTVATFRVVKKRPN